MYQNVSVYCGGTFV